MDVAAEGDLGFRRHDAARGVQCVLDIAPPPGIAGFGMNVEAVIFLQRQRQLRQKTPLCRAEPAARPLDRRLGFGIHRYCRGADGAVMVAAHRDGTALDEIHHYLDRVETTLAPDPTDDPVSFALFEALAILMGGGIKNIDSGINMSMQVQKKRVNEYMHRLNVAGLGDRRERMNPMLKQFLDN